MIDKLKLLELTSNLAERESDRTWRRFSIFLTMNGALIALVAIARDGLGPFGAAMSSTLGLALAVIWYKVIVISKYYERRWHEDMLAIIKSDEELTEWIKARSSETARIGRPTRHSASSYVKVFVIILALMWGSLLIGSVYSLAKAESFVDSISGIIELEKVK